MFTEVHLCTPRVSPHCKGMSSKTFQDEFCAPAKQVELWIAGVKKTYGDHAKTPAATRVFDWLASGKARVQVLACICDIVRLEGISEEKSATTPGLLPRSAAMAQPALPRAALPPRAALLPRAATLPWTEPAWRLTLK